MNKFKAGDKVLCLRTELLYGKICDCNDKNPNKIEWITVHVINGRRGEFINPKHLNKSSF